MPFIERNEHFDSYGSMGANLARKTITFSNTGPGAETLYTVTGDVIVKLIGVCTADLIDAAGGGTVEVGLSGATAAIIAQTTTTAVDAREIWHDNSPDSEIEALSVFREYIITDGNDVILTIGTQDVDSGALVFYCFWIPLSADGNVVAA